MTDGQLLFIVFAALYLLECVRLMPTQAWLCNGRVKGQWHVRPSSSLWSGRGLALFFLRPLPPFDAHFIALPWIFVPREEGLVVREGSGSGRVVAWAEVDPKADECSLRVGGAVIARLPSAPLAGEWSERLREWKMMDAGAREAAFRRWVADSLDPAPVEQMAESLTDRTRALRSNAAWIMVWCFGVVTGIHAWYGETQRLWIAVSGLFVLQWMQAAMFWSAARHDPALRHRLWKTLAIALLPQHSIRAADHFFRVALRTPHPLAARTIMQEMAFLDVARAFWREARFHPGWSRGSDLPLEAEALQLAFKRAAVSIDTLEAPPQHDGTSTSYCPRCMGQFLSGIHECRDCGGVELRAFKAPDRV